MKNSLHVLLEQLLIHDGTFQSFEMFEAEIEGTKP